MSLTYWNQFREFSTSDTPLSLMFRHVVPESVGVGRDWNWRPAVDVYETDDRELVITAELPGVDREDVRVTLENGMLTIAGERKLDDAVDQQRWYRSERAHGTFRRSFAVPENVDLGEVTAEHKAGTLLVRLPLKEEAKPHHITVNAA